VEEVMIEVSNVGVAGAFPLKMPVVGMLEPTGAADDEAIFVDLKTMWVIAGLAHGHQDMSGAKEGDSGVIKLLIWVSLQTGIAAC
jgi:hypothetical protein